MLRDKLSFLGDQDIELLLRSSQRRHVVRGETIVREGQSPEAIFLVQEGFISVRAGGVTVGYFGPGQILGEISFLERRSASATVVAEGDAVLNRIDNADLEALLSAHPDLAARFYRSLAVSLSRRVRALSGSLTKLRGQRSHKARYGQLSARHVPSSLIDGLTSVLREVQRVEESLAARRMAPDAAARVVASSCDRVVALLEEHTTEKALLAISVDDLLTFRDISRLREGVGSFVFRICFALLMSSATIARLYDKPGGVAEDDGTRRAIADADAEGDGLIGPLVDRWFLDRPVCRARRDSRKAMAAEIVRRATEHAGPGAFLVTSIGSGGGDELLDAMDEAGEGVLAATCIDPDPDALRRGNHLASEAGHASSMTFLCAEPLSLSGSGSEIFLGPQHMVYALYFFDYLSDDDAVALLDWIWGHLAPSGTAVWTALGPDLTDLPMMEHLLEWAVVPRDAPAIRALVSRSRFGRAVEVQPLEGSSLHMVTCTREPAP
ncbi:cyclic nucleotide-binding domain-containing protein [Polyangium mundeleinium]|uniref:Cyclic nucleotide-binding domain-containing protein n=1 Tax=Polyangium mundeleinium TaxID=2995306 RepID=A0ABT5EL24_9BACT|nr:cyclic nucleotide-binding domain-containing protein [Polyangium mundeleinium]MDC0742072.1 cyclic nucleotide-binding domain-containing protein [Polyangium mundeleinium]